MISGETVEVFENYFLTPALDLDKHIIAKELTIFSLEAFAAAGKDTGTIIHLEKGSISNRQYTFAVRELCCGEPEFFDVGSRHDFHVERILR